MKKLAVMIALLVLTGCFSGVALSAPSFSGSTGMLRVPSADTLRTGQFDAGQYYWQDGGTTVWGIHAMKGMEISGSIPWNRDIHSNSTYNIKFNLNGEALLIPAVSIGIEDIDGRDKRTVYWALSKALPYGVRLHLGSGTGRFEGFFFAIEKVLNPRPIRQSTSGAFPVTSLVVEYDGLKMNYGVRLRVAQGIRFDSGWLGKERRVYLGLTYTN